MEMNGSEFNDLARKSAQGRLGPTDEARLKALLSRRPSDREEWESELALERLLQDMEDTPVSSNFTALVLQKANAREIRPRRSFFSRFAWAGGAPAWRRAVGLATLCAAFALIFARGQIESKRASMARDVAAVSSLANVLASESAPAKATPLSDLEMWQDFDAIKRLDQVPQEVDMDLLLALQ